VLFVLVVVVSLAGCSLLFGGGDDSTSLPTGDQAAEQYLSMDGYEATVHYEYSDQSNRRAQLQIDVDGGNSRIEWLGPDRLAGNVQTYNGSTTIRYNATTNEYVSISTSNLDNFEDGAERIEEAVDAAREDGTATVDQPPSGGAPLPVVPEGGTADAAASDRYEVTYDGTEQVAGREAHVISYAPVENVTDGVLEQTVWVDTEYFITLKSHSVSRYDGDRSTFTFRLSNVSIAPGLSERDFSFDPPANATLNASDSYDVTGYDTRAQLVTVADIGVPDPAVPERFTLSRATHIVGQNFTAVQLQYQTSGSRLLVTKTSEQTYTDLTEGERVTIGDETGRYRTSQTRATVAWRCGGYVYTVTGGVQKETLLDVARSIECR
jgi:outer membrane lipoprotein-sorting protein